MPLEVYVCPFCRSVQAPAGMELLSRVYNCHICRKQFMPDGNTYLLAEKGDVQVPAQQTTQEIG